MVFILVQQNWRKSYLSILKIDKWYIVDIYGTIVHLCWSIICENRYLNMEKSQFYKIISGIGEAYFSSMTSSSDFSRASSLVSMDSLLKGTTRMTLFVTTCSLRY